MPTYKEYEAQSVDIIKQAKGDFGSGLFVLSSFGNESALMLKLLEKSEIEAPVLTIDTGFWFEETHQHQKDLEKQLGFTALNFGPSDQQIDKISEQKLWETDLKRYNRLTKLYPLSAAIRELGVTALLSGVRGYQNENRAALRTYGTGNDEEWRIHPVLNWSEEMVDEYFADNNLPRHPLYYEGYGSIGDWTITTPGEKRTGRNLDTDDDKIKSECGLHTQITTQ